MQWLNQIVEDIVKRFPEGDLLIESGASPSGAYHVGHLREPVICDAITLVLQKNGRNARHLQFIDDLDAFRKVPVNVSEDFQKYLGMPLCDVPSPEGDGSYAEYFLKDWKHALEYLGVDVEYMYSHEKYRSGFFESSIEVCLDNVDAIRQIFERVSQRSLDENWNPVQVMQDGRLKNRQIKGIDKQAKTVTYVDNDGNDQTAKYDDGNVKLDWRLDWPARWQLLNVSAEPFGREHASKGGSYDSGAAFAREVFKIDPPIPVPYDSIHRTGDTKKMSASKGTGISASEIIKLLPAEVIRFFNLQYPPSKILYFDPIDGVIKLIDEYAALLAKQSKTADDELLLELCTRGLDHKTVSQVPFSHLVSSYQSALKDIDKTLEVIRRTEYREVVKSEEEIIRSELKFIDEWLNLRAPEDVKFELSDNADSSKFDDNVKKFFMDLATKIEAAPEDADGAWFHNAIYELKDSSGIPLNDMFSSLYILLINKKSGPRAGWFLSILPRDWLIKRLKLEG